MFEGTFTLEEYKVDMLGRVQTDHRIANVSESLAKVSEALVPVTKVKGEVTKTFVSTNASSKKGKRL